ncbi:MAG: peptide chain release factor 2 [Candidatus Saccharimonas sp.]
MQPIKKRVSSLTTSIEAAFGKLKIADKQARLAELNVELSDGDVWSDAEHARIISQEAATLESQIAPWLNLQAEAREISELLGLDDESIREELDKQLAGIELEYLNRRKELLFDGKLDDHNAIIKISAGAGGVDAQDWAQMLERMYLRWAEKSNFKVELIERSAGEEAGIKSVTYAFRGVYAYGKLRSEHGVHRLVRLSPFNADNLRQTSFALVEVLPEIDTADEAEIDDKDLKIDVYRSGGHGGQSVNTTDSAVRVTHLPTGIVIAIQNERSQLQNRETAMKILRGKLLQLQDEQRAEAISDLRTGESASWGNQIRNYVLHPYTLVKDTRTKHETHNASGVLDGDIDEFIEAYLESSTE